MFVSLVTWCSICGIVEGEWKGRERGGKVLGGGGKEEVRSGRRTGIWLRFQSALYRLNLCLRVKPYLFLTYHLPYLFFLLPSHSPPPPLSLSLSLFLSPSSPSFLSSFVPPPSLPPTGRRYSWRTTSRPRGTTCSAMWRC